MSASYGAETELSPLLTTHSDALVDTAKSVIHARLVTYDVGIDQRRLAAAIDMVVRLLLSHMSHPSGPPTRTADDIAWIVDRALRP